MDDQRDAPPLGPRQGRQFTWEIVAAAAATLAAVSAIAVIGIFWMTRQSDLVSIDRQAHMALHAIMSSVDELALQQETVAIWDETAMELAKPEPDRRWLHDNIGLWLHNIFNHDEVFILDGGDRPVQAALRGEPAPAVRFEKLRPDLQRGLDTLRGRLHQPNGPHDRLPGLALPGGSTVLTTNRATHRSNLAMVGGRPAAVSTMLIRSSTRGYVRVEGPPPVLVSIRYLDRDFMADLQKKHLIDEAHFSSVRESDRELHSVALTTARGEPMGYFSWRPRLPGTLLRAKLIPLAIIVLAAFGLLLFAFARRLQATAAELVEVEARARRLALHDPLTGLPNRALLAQRLGDLPLRSQERPWLLLIDLDHFKQVNDTLGHLAGDRLIREFAERLSALAGTGDTVARLGGDEFAVIVGGGLGELDVSRTCGDILAAVARPFSIDGTRLHAGASIGAAAADAGIDATELMRRADVALYRAKAEGRNCIRFYDRDMDEANMERALFESELRRAIEAGHLETWYQPEVAPDGTVVGYEALLRWDHPACAGGMDRVIAIAEDSGLIVEIGDIVLRSAAEASAQHPGVFVAVNLAALQFRSEGFVDRVIGIVAGAGADPACIELEVTERMLLSDEAGVASGLARLRRAGFRIALDDFGTGYCSLGYLQRFRIDKIKIDRSFVANVDRSAEARAIIAAMVALGHALHLKVTAEGVERPEQVALLRAAGCDELQGFHFAPARPWIAPPAAAAANA